MSNKLDPALTVAAGVAIGFIAGGVFCASFGVYGPPFQYGDASRAGLVKWLYDWQQLIAGVLAIGAAGITALLLWRQVDANRREAAAGERAAVAAMSDLLARRLSEARELEHRFESALPAMAQLVAKIDAQQSPNLGVWHDIIYAALDHVRNEADQTIANARRTALSTGSWEALMVFEHLTSAFRETFSNRPWSPGSAPTRVEFDAWLANLRPLLPQIQQSVADATIALQSETYTLAGRLAAVDAQLQKPEPS